MSEEQKYQRDAFENWWDRCEVGVASLDAWGPWWDCWKAAIDAHTEAAKDSPPSERKEPA